MTDAEVIEAVAGWNTEESTYEVEFFGPVAMFSAKHGELASGFMVGRVAFEMIEPEAFEGIRIGLDFALSTSRAAVEIAGGFSRS